MNALYVQTPCVLELGEYTCLHLVNVSSIVQQWHGLVYACFHLCIYVQLNGDCWEFPARSDREYGRLPLAPCKLKQLAIPATGSFSVVKVTLLSWYAMQ